MNPLHKKFAKEYIDTGNATEAVQEVFGVEDPNYAGVKGHRLLRNDKVKEYLTSQAEKASSKMVKLMEQEENLGVSFNATKDILDRAGYKPVEKSEHLIDLHTYNPEDKAKIEDQLDNIIKLNE